MEKRIGQQLREAREAKKLTLEEVSFATKIPVDRLGDLENDHLTSLGGMVYTRSFVKQYADHLGLDLQAEIQELPISPLAGAEDYQYLLQNYGPWVSNQPEPKEALRAPVSGVETRSFRFFTWFTCSILFMLTGGILAYVLFLKYQPLASTAKESGSEPTPLLDHPARQSWQEDAHPKIPTSLQSPTLPDHVPKAIPVEE